MKKLITIATILILTLALTGCGETTQDIKDGFYTQEEIDLMLNDYESEILQQQEHDDELRNEIDKLKEDLLELNDYMKYDFESELEEYLDDKLEEYNEENKLTQEENIIYSTIAMLDILIYTYEQEVEDGTIFTDDEIAYYELIMSMRDMYISELEEIE